MWKLQEATENLKNFVYGNREKKYFNDDEFDLNLTEYQKLLAEAINVFCFILTNFSSGALHKLKQLFIIETTFVKNFAVFLMRQSDRTRD